MEPARLPTTESNGLHILWTHLREANSDIKFARCRLEEARTIQLHVWDLLDDGLSRHALQPLLDMSRQHVTKQTEDMLKLEERRDNIRLAINEQLRPLLRPLTVLDLPDEVLMHIFDYVRGETGMHDLDFFDHRTGDVKQVKNLRLTCRRFCDASSHLLMYYVKVEMTPQSIAYLKMSHFKLHATILTITSDVSRHPTISKGIRAVQIFLGRHFDADIARDIGAFMRYQASRIRSTISYWERFVTLPALAFDGTPKDVYERAIGKATSFVAHCHDAIRNGLDMSCPEHVLLAASQEQYRRCYESQVLLQRGRFAEAVACAMKRMPTATWLVIEDENTDSTLDAPDRMSAAIFPGDLEDPALLQQKLEAPEFSWSTARLDRLRSAPMDTIPRILQSLQDAALCLKGIDICVPLPDDLSCLSTTEIDHPKLRSISQNLRAFKFNPRHAWKLPLDTSNLLLGFLSTILDTCTLQKIDLCMDFQYDRDADDPPTFSMAPVLLSRTWPQLKWLSYNGAFHFEELQEVVNRLGKVVDLEWSGYLMDASWAEVLDFLKGRLSPGSFLGDVNGSIAGAECDGMDGVQIDFLFGEERPFSPSRATKFIRGWTDTNPVRDWVNGDLMMPEENGDDWSVTSGDD